MFACITVILTCNIITDKKMQYLSEFKKLESIKLLQINTLIACGRKSGIRGATDKAETDH